MHFLKVDIPFLAAMAGLQDYNGRIYFALITVDYPALTVTRPGAKLFIEEDQKMPVWYKDYFELKASEMQM